MSSAARGFKYVREGAESGDKEGSSTELKRGASSEDGPEGMLVKRKSWERFTHLCASWAHGEG